MYSVTLSESTILKSGTGITISSVCQVIVSLFILNYNQLRVSGDCIFIYSKSSSAQRDCLFIFLAHHRLNVSGDCLFVYSESPSGDTLFITDVFNIITVPLTSACSTCQREKV
jgi:hypothetical protein